MKERLQIAIEQSNLTRSQVCQLSGIGKASLSEYLSGKSEPRKDSIDALAEVLKVSPAWLVGYDVPKDFDLLNQDGKEKVEEFISEILPRYENKEGRD